MIVRLYYLLLLAFCTQQCCSYSFDKYKSALLNSGNECQDAFSSLDVISQLKFFDASAKIPVGLIQGHFINLGAFDECLDINVPQQKVIGKYCTARSTFDLTLLENDSDNQTAIEEKLNFNQQLAENINQQLQKVVPSKRLKEAFTSVSLKLGICLPNVCRNYSIFLKQLFLQIDETACVTKETNSQMSTKARISWYVIVFYAVIAVLSTIYDVIIDRYEKEPHHELLIAFSLYTNGKKLCKTTNNPSQLLCLNGLKTLNMIWVIAGHTYGSLIQGPVDNYLDVISWIHQYSSMIIAGATVSVDSFFTIGGILSVYTLLRSQDPGLKSNIKNVPWLYLHRYLRLTPAFAIIVYIYWSGLPSYMGNGPMWNLVDANMETCKENWWAALLYIQNYRAQECVGQSWYLSVDMQLFLLSPLIWIPLRKWPKETLRAMYGLVLLGIVIPFGLTYYYKLPGFMLGTPNNDVSNIYYLKTHARFGTYVIGMIAGYYIYHAKQKKRITINSVALFWLWTSTVIILYGCVYVGFPLVDKESPTPQGTPKDVDEATRWWNSIYVALVRPAWSTALSVLIYLCVTGYGGPVNWFLSTGPMQFLAKLSYCMYLNHGIFVIFYIGQTRDTWHFGNWQIINCLIAIIIVIIPASIVHTLLFESPMICIERIIFGKSKSPRKNEERSKNGV